MSAITVERQISPQRLAELGVQGWPVWEKGISSFPWRYGEAETCYLIAGCVEVTPEGGEPVVISKGDLATFASGLRCTWKITEPLAKYYHFG